MDGETRLAAHRLKLRHFHFVAALAATGSMARTADRLSVSYPAVVKTRLEIEEVLGAKLTQGRGDGATLTDIGACLVSASHRILNELDCAAQEIAALQGGLNGHVIVGVRSQDALRWLAPRITQFRAGFPGVSISFVDGLHESVARGEVDLGIARAGPARWPNELVLQPLFAIRSVIVASGAYRQASLDWPALLQAAWVLPPVGTPLRDNLENYLSHRGLPSPDNFIEGSDAMVQKELLRAGSFVAVSSEEVARGLVEERIAQVLKGDVTAFDDHIALIWRAHRRMHPAVYTLKRFLLGKTERRVA